MNRYLDFFLKDMGWKILYRKCNIYVEKDYNWYIYSPKTNTTFCSIRLHMWTVRQSLLINNHYISLISFKFDMRWDRGQRNYYFTMYSRCASF